MSALLALASARIDVGGAALIDGVSFETQSDNVGLVGGFDALFALAAGRGHLASGRVTIRGQHPWRAVRDGHVGLALADAVLPESWTALAYLEQSAELLGLSARSARAQARAALARTGLPHLESRRIATLTMAERRALLIAHTTLGGPDVLLLEAPLSRLDTQGEAFVSAVLELAAASCSVIASVPAATPIGGERALLERLGEVVVMEAGAIVAQGSPATAIPSGSRYSLTVTRLGKELAQRLVELGLSATITTERPEGARLIVDLGQGASTDDLLDAALAVGAPVVELMPLEPTS